ncbi:hypothetical protein, partial [Pseudomonas syringae group genomosp. 7]|uniref:hypothetical protein n=1 Tax=Pseudomonas syringae group genomosp. 7 TaxID=251699 RepID=UPI00377025E5
KQHSGIRGDAADTGIQITYPEGRCFLEDTHDGSFCIEIGSMLLQGSEVSRLWKVQPTERPSV